jgi:hypothetical protein
MNTYGALWQDKELSVEAETTYQAQQKAQEIFQRGTRKKVKGYDITVMLTHLNGVEYIHIPSN